MIGLTSGSRAASNLRFGAATPLSRGLAELPLLTRTLTFQHLLFWPKPSEVMHPSQYQLTRSRPRQSMILSWLTSRLHRCLHHHNQSCSDAGWKNQRHLHIFPTPLPLPGPTHAVASLRSSQCQQSPRGSQCILLVQRPLTEVSACLSIRLHDRPASDLPSERTRIEWPISTPPSWRVRATYGALSFPKGAPGCQNLYLCLLSPKRETARVEMSPSTSIASVAGYNFSIRHSRTAAFKALLRR